MADKLDVSGEVPRPVATPADGEGAHQFGLAAAMALIILVLSIALGLRGDGPAPAG